MFEPAEPITSAIHHSLISLLPLLLCRPCLLWHPCRLVLRKRANEFKTSMRVCKGGHEAKGDAHHASNIMPFHDSRVYDGLEDSEGDLRAAELP